MKATEWHQQSCSDNLIVKLKKIIHLTFFTILRLGN